MTLKQAPDSQAQPSDHPIARDRLAGIVGTRWLKTAGRPEPRRDPESVSIEEGHTHRFHAIPHGR